MELFIICVAFVFVWIAVLTVKEMRTDARYRWEDRVMANYLEAEEARFHQQRLAAIDTAVQATEEELVRIAAEARGEIIESTAVELDRP